MKRVIQTDAEDAQRKKANVIMITDEEARLISKTKPDENMSVSQRILIESALEKSRDVEEEKSAEEETVVEEEVVEEEEPEENSKDPDFRLSRRSKGSKGSNLNKCPHCTKSFKKPSDLVRHVRIHTGEKPFACTVCSRAFTVKSTLESHMLTHKQSECDSEP